MSFTLLTTRHFDRRVSTFRKMHPDLKKKLSQILMALESDPFQPSLRLHALKGELQGLHAVSITYAYRMTLTLKITDREIILLDIGSHDEVYR